MRLLLSSVKKATISAVVNSLERSLTTQFCIHCTLGSMDEWREDDAELDFSSSTTTPASAAAVRPMPEVIFWFEDVVTTEVALGREFSSAMSSDSLMSIESEP